MPPTADQKNVNIELIFVQKATRKASEQNSDQSGRTEHTMSQKIKAVCSHLLFSGYLLAARLNLITQIAVPDVPDVLDTVNG